MRALLLTLSLTLGCTPPPAPPQDTADAPDTGAPAPTDADGDGHWTPEDCDDTNASVHPGAEEVCDLRDNDCDGAIDDDAADAITWYPDSDGDGFGDGAAPAESCTALDGHLRTDGDCDDSDAAVSPDAREVCDKRDNDCDAEIDEDDVCTSCGDGVREGREECDDGNDTLGDGCNAACFADVAWSCQEPAGCSWDCTGGTLVMDRALSADLSLTDACSVDVLVWGAGGGGAGSSHCAGDLGEDGMIIISPIVTL